MADHQPNPAEHPGKTAPKISQEGQMADTAHQAEVELLTDEERIAYWQGAYERMAARNHELAAERDQMMEALRPFAQYFSRQETRLSSRGGFALGMPRDRKLHSIPVDRWRDAVAATSPNPSPAKDRA